VFLSQNTHVTQLHLHLVGNVQRHVTIEHQFDEGGVYINSHTQLNSTQLNSIPAMEGKKERIAAICLQKRAFLPSLHIFIQGEALGGFKKERRALEPPQL
jgi:hypothetical protein